MTPRTMTAEREAYWRSRIERLGNASRELLAELDAERAEPQRLQARVETLTEALTGLMNAVNADQSQLDAYSNFDRAYARANAALHPEPAAGAWKTSDPVWPPRSGEPENSHG